MKKTALSLNPRARVERPSIIGASSPDIGAQSLSPREEPVSANPLKSSRRKEEERPSRILIADDDDLVRGSLGAVLESEGYVVDEARDGHEAVQCAISHSPDIVLLDLNMPGWDGWTAFAQLDRITPLVPVIVITARPNQYEKAVKLGVDAFMEKPLNLHILLRAIQRLVSEASDRHFRRITDRGFVTRLLSGMQRTPDHGNGGPT